MIPLKLTLSGFMSYRAEQTLDFKDDALWVLVGKNASGKSSIFDAIIFVLFGKTRIKGIPNGELVNHYSDIAEITFDFAVGNKRYRVRRTINKNGSATRQASILLSKPDSSFVPQPIPLTHKEKEFKDWIDNEIGLNYEVFVTSVLLRQGKADEFLESPTETRYDVLSKLVDISKYVALEGKAREQKNFWSARAVAHQDNLRRISVVTEQDFADAQIDIARESDAVESAQLLENKLQTIFGQANQWERLSAELLVTNENISKQQGLLNRADEINKCYERLINLRNVMPSLKVAFDLTGVIKHDETEAQRLSIELSTNEDAMKTHQRTVGELEADYQKKASRVEEISGESTRNYRRLNELSSVVNLIARLEQLEKELESHHNALAKFPDNLDEMLKAAEMERDRLLEAKQTIPSLSRLVAERTRLAEAEERRLRLTKQMQEKNGVRPDFLRAKEKAHTDLRAAEDLEKSMRDALIKAVTLLDSARTQMENFSQVANSAKCQYCGTNLTESHKVQERRRLTAELTEKSELAEKAQNKHNQVVNALDDAKTLCNSTTNNLGILDTEINSIAQKLEGSERDIRDQLDAISMTYDVLPYAYQIQVCSFKPSDLNVWAETIYPQNTDIEELKSAVKRVAQTQANVARLAGQITKRNDKRTLWINAGDTLDTVRETLPPDWKDLEAEHKSLSASEKHINDLLEAAQKDKRDVNAVLEKAKNELQIIQDRQSRLVGILETKQSSLQRSISDLAHQVAQLPEYWQAETQSMTEGKLSLLMTEMAQLREYEELHQELAAAGQSLKSMQARLAEIQKTISTLPVGSHRPAIQVEKELSDARDVSRQAEGRLGKAKTQYALLLAQQEHYKEEDANMKVAARKAHLYGILSDQLGEKGIQKAIINKAEIEIVRLSNQMLDNLSGGRSKLRLREAGGNKKALDLEVWDSETGGAKPILAGLASGSQRFRIAISLALGIGQYIGHESNRIESVIIDEGFGSLDREGRESIIQELYNLSQHLKRIILVSHQEEFSRGFSTGYEVQLVDGASQIRPLVQ
jgi:DNA repair protein SbcC/Rad50